MSNLGLAKHYLGIEITQTRKKISLTQIKYITNMLKHFGMEDCAPKPTLMNDKIQLDVDITSNLLSKTNKEYFQQAIRSLLYLLLETRQDISIAITILI